MIQWMTRCVLLFTLATVVKVAAFPLEDTENTVWAGSRGEPLPCTAIQSCQHRPRRDYVGLDYKGEDFVSIDIGRCQAMVTKEAENTSGSGQAPPTLCTCEASSYSYDTFLTRQGPYMHDTVTGCTATPLTACRRRPAHYTFHANTSYQITKELGQCVGGCEGSEDSCLPTSKVSLAIKGPNGYDTVDRITQCGCGSKSCYRQDYYKVFHMLETTAEGNDTAKQVVEKEVNVGVCVGKCHGIIVPQKCRLWSHGVCVWSVAASQAFCVANETSNEEYVDVYGVTRNITAVQSCLCGGLSPD